MDKDVDEGRMMYCWDTMDGEGGDQFAGDSHTDVMIAKGAPRR